MKFNKILFVAVRVWAVSMMLAAGFCLMLAFSGCASINEAWMKAYVAVHDAADAALSNKPPVIVSAVTNAVPTVKPDPAKGCGCDLSKPRAVFGVPALGATESKVGEWLRKRWASGTDDSCGGLPQDRKSVV